MIHVLTPQNLKEIQNQNHLSFLASGIRITQPVHNAESVVGFSFQALFRSEVAMDPKQFQSFLRHTDGELCADMKRRMSAHV